MKKTFFISDTHFGHERILTYENRPFETLGEMDKVLIKNWNNKVKKEHQVYVLGDVSFYKKDKTKEILGQLNGTKILIMGNHDRHKSPKYWKEAGFDEVSKYPILFEGQFMLSHEPIPELLDCKSFYNIHGHLHSHGSIYPNDRWFNVCIERNNYKPVDFEKIRRKLAGGD